MNLEQFSIISSWYKFQKLSDFVNYVTNDAELTAEQAACVGPPGFGLFLGRFEFHCCGICAVRLSKNASSVPWYLPVLSSALVASTSRYFYAYAYVVFGSGFFYRQQGIDVVDFRTFFAAAAVVAMQASAAVGKSPDTEMFVLVQPAFHKEDVRHDQLPSMV